MIFSHPCPLSFFIVLLQLLFCFLLLLLPYQNHITSFSSIDTPSKHKNLCRLLTIENPFCKTEQDNTHMHVWMNECSTKTYHTTTHSHKKTTQSLFKVCTKTPLLSLFSPCGAIISSSSQTHLLLYLTNTLMSMNQRNTRPIPLPQSNQIIWN